jgi:hypothetical protein
MPKMIPPQYKEGGLHGPSNDKIAHHTVLQKVRKIKGYKYPGVIVSVFYTLDKNVRYVVEADHPDFRGMLHIFSDGDIEER